MIIKCKDISVSDGTSYHSLIDNKVADGNSYVPMQMEKFGVCHGNDYYVPYASIMDTQDAGVKTPVDSYSYESYTYVFEGNEYIVT